MDLGFELNKDILETPTFWFGALHGFATLTEELSPDYTIAHHVAAIIQRVTGNAEISTPTATSVKPLVEAVADSARAMAPSVLPALANVAVASQKKG